MRMVSSSDSPLAAEEKTLTSGGEYQTGIPRQLAAWTKLEWVLVLGWKKQEDDAFPVLPGGNYLLPNQLLHLLG
jgi:hypothetical protein